MCKYTNRMIKINIKTNLVILKNFSDFQFITTKKIYNHNEYIVKLRKKPIIKIKNFFFIKEIFYL